MKKEKYVNILSEDFVDIVLEIFWSVSRFWQHYLILVMSIYSLKSFFLPISFFNTYLVIRNCSIKLMIFNASSLPIQDLVYQRE